MLQNTKPLLPVSRKQNKMKREPGYYWVRKASGWAIAKYTKFDDWDLPGLNKSFDDKDFDEINETRLIAPDEQQG